MFSKGWSGQFRPHQPFFHAPMLRGEPSKSADLGRVPRPESGHAVGRWGAGSGADGASGAPSAFHPRVGPDGPAVAGVSLSAIDPKFERLDVGEVGVQFRLPSRPHDPRTGEFAAIAPHRKNG